jgi:hypothetical protein
MTRAAPAETGPPRWREVFAGARGRLTTGLLILEALIAIEILIVAAILPTAQKDLHGLQLYGWNYAALTLAMGAAVLLTSICPSLADSPRLNRSVRGLASQLTQQSR